MIIMKAHGWQSTLSDGGREVKKGGRYGRAGIVIMPPPPLLGDWDRWAHLSQVGCTLPCVAALALAPGWKPAPPVCYREDGP